MAQVEVPYLLEEPTLEAEKLLKSAGLGWKITGNPLQHSIVQDQNPAPGKMVEAGSTVVMHVITPAAPHEMDPKEAGSGPTIVTVHQP